MKNTQDINQEADFEEFIGDEPNFEAGGGPADGSPEPDKVTDEPVISADPAEDTDWKDKYTRLSAEFDNFRKRTYKEKQDLAAYGSREVILAILPVLDDMDRAVDALEKSDNIDSAREGMKLIRQRLIETLKQQGVCEIVSNDADFDTDLHEAVTRFPSEDKKGKVIDTIQKGYKLRDKVIRFCKVVVGD